ncbi:Ref family recombination enhancement nuclease [Lelliottia nimipressuralis]|uniref:DUF968 domain-containing protein n=1 Tax=Lelliottia nimipressuralis TaxID=69220 RepID=A0ABD4K6N9_9ENTR|nr:Ref family recombination enhancement nuclease [Lelliottia nimipressuralis]MBF4177259.1 hypothetical protein [Lelliottia nimipressuralis]
MAKRQNKAEKAHTDKVAQLGCVACYVMSGKWGTPGQIHHPRAGQGMGQRSGWFKVICLCVNHHTNSGNGKLAIHSGYESFTSMYGNEEELLNLTLDNL